jgi:hypothetical protein
MTSKAKKADTASHCISSNSPSGDREVPRCILSLFSFIRLWTDLRRIVFMMSVCFPDDHAAGPDGLQSTLMM